MTLNKTDRIVITLGKQIVHGKYVPGSPLPAEAELCEEFATSRNIIREVFRSLMAKRLIEMKRYRGAFVAPRNQWNYLDTDVLQWVLENDYDPRLISAMSEVRIWWNRRLPVGQQSARPPAIWRRLNRR